MKPQANYLASEPSPLKKKLQRIIITLLIYYEDKTVFAMYLSASYTHLAALISTSHISFKSTLTISLKPLKYLMT